MKKCEKFKTFFFLHIFSLKSDICKGLLADQQAGGCRSIQYNTIFVEYKLLTIDTAAIVI